MKIRILLVLFMALAAIGVSAQEGGIKGKVVTRTGRLAIDGAKVTLNPGNRTTYSTTDGNFSFENLPEGEYTLTFEATDFDPVDITVRVAKTFRDIQLVPMAAQVTMQNLDGTDFADFDFDAFDDVQSTNSTLSASKDLFSNIAGYRFSEMRFNPRGLRNEEVYLNGVRMNDALTGYSPWSLWGGLNDATRNQENTSGVAVTDYGVGGINGSTNINARASQMRKGLRTSLVNGSASYRFRVMATYASGLQDNGWSYAFSFSTRQGTNSWVDGCWYNAWAYFGSVEKRFNEQHNLAFTFFGTPVQRSVQSAAVQEIYDLLGNNFYNSNWGWQDGKMRSARVRNNHEPVAMLNYTYTSPNNKTTLNAAVSYRFGRNGYSALDWYNADDPRPDYYRKLPSYYTEGSPQWEALTYAWTQNLQQYTQIDWDRLYDVNRANVNTYMGGELPDGVLPGMTRSKYVIEERRTDQNDLNFKVQLEHPLNSWSNIVYGASYRWNKTEYYKILKDLLGGQYWVDVDQFAERDFAMDPDAIQNNLNTPNRAVYEGDKYGYDYYARINESKIWATYSLTRNWVEAYAALEGGNTNFWREGLYRKGLFPGVGAGANASEGKSEVQNFWTYKMKAGAVFLISGAHNIGANIAYMHTAPYFQYSFVSPRTRNEVTPGLKTEKTFAVDVNYNMRYSFMKLRVAAYYTKLQDVSKVLSFYDDYQRAFTNFAMSDIDQRHMGIEVAMQVPIVGGLSFNGALSLGSYVYTSNPNVTQTVDNSAEKVLENVKVYWKGMYVESTPQTAANLGLSYRSSNNWFAGLDLNIYDRMYLSMNPLYRTEVAYMTGRLELGENGLPTAESQRLMDEMTQQEEFDPACVLNANVGKIWYLKKGYQLGFSLEVKNILNNKNIRTGGYEQTRLQDDYSSGTLRYQRFPSRYFYLYGINYYLNVYFRF